MMYWYGNGGGWMWPWMLVGNILFWLLIIIVAVLIFRAFAQRSHSGGHPNQGTPPPPGTPGHGSGAEQILSERYARGEIDEEEYQRRLATLRGSPSGPTQS
ncbi:SHOCT domain-containing protein [Streptomyces sp. NPDC057743]|uniref:SHOCT domain-containing protein n=1 Tax=Streptomyces sp. NPDC057743 TaxID=3346236 RepID=UPI0036A0EF06